MSRKKEYSNGEVTVVWEPDKCIHSGICVKGLPDVFRPKLRPWVAINAAHTEAIIQQVKHCPSGALSFYENGKIETKDSTLSTKVEVLKDGPLLVYGTLEVVGVDGVETPKNNTTAFCRCGASKLKPYCDGTHAQIDFKG
jgi:uncharacterized Fe-S cluster protein YjdI